MLRITSTYTRARPLTSQFLERRAMPTIVPKIVANTMPNTAVRNVFRMPTVSALP